MAPKCDPANPTDEPSDKKTKASMIKKYTVFSKNLEKKQCFFFRAEKFTRYNRLLILLPMKFLIQKYKFFNFQDLTQPKVA